VAPVLRDHLVLVRHTAVEALRGVELVHIERGEAVELHRAKVAALIGL